MAIDKKFSDFEKRMKSMKDEMLKDIISDTQLSKLEKLRLISSNNLMESDSSWCDPFEDKYRELYINIVVETPKFKDEWGKYNIPAGGYRNWVTIDDYFVINDYQRHQMVDLADVAEGESMNDKIAIYTDRTTHQYYTITAQEFVDAIYDWVIKNNTIAFELDW